MKLCFVADGRSPHARNWMTYLARSGHEVHLISTYPCEEIDPPFASLHVVPLDFSAKARSSVGGGGAKTFHGSPLFARLRGGVAWRTLARVRDQVAPWVVPYQCRRVRKIIGRIDPDLVHAMRIPFEGILAASALRADPIPLVLSIWGIDFTFAAAGSPKLARMVSQACVRADAVHPDCYRDLRLAKEFGFSADRPAIVVPGNGGVQTRIFRNGTRDAALSRRLDIAEGSPVILNPRGVKPYIQTDNFFRSIPLILARQPECHFLGAMMAGNTIAEGWVERLKIADSVRLLDYVPHTEMAGIFRLADVAVSVSDHDGTPNTLLEAMACGAFPVAGDIESVREWIDDGINGLLCDQSSPESIAEAVLRGIEDDALRARAGRINESMIDEKADYDRIMATIPGFYEEVIGDVARRASMA